jgi:hypothetical protein
MSALVKTKLKAARDAIGKKDWDAAQTAATTALDYEPDNYNACAITCHPIHTRSYAFDVETCFLALLPLSLARTSRASK